MNSITQLGLGTAALGRPQYINVRQEEVQTQDLDAFKKNGFNILEKAYELGIRYFDTAPGYGLAEQLLLDWLEIKNDEAIRVATKWGYTYVANFDSNAKVHEIKEHSLSKLEEQWKVSKALLPQLKVYQIHSATLETRVLENEPILNQLAYLKNEFGLEIGITTTGANQVDVIKRALDVSIEGHSLFDAFQVTYNMLDQSLISVYDELLKLNKKVIVKEALANGRLFKNNSYQHYSKLYNVLELMSKKYDVGIDAIALSFCGQTLPNSVVLSGASNIRHLQDNIKSTSFSLTEEEIKELSSFRINEINYWEERKQLGWR